MRTTVHRRTDVGSTNDEAFALREGGETPPFWVVAERQLAGRGRLGRAWISERGNLYASLLLHRPAVAALLPTLPLVASIAVRRAIVALGCPPTRVSLKWPNDVLLNKHKIAGLLLEAKNGGETVVIGCGVNCQHHPELTRYQATDLRAAGLESEPHTLFADLTTAFERVLDEWNAGRNFASLRSEWLQAAHGLGETVTVDTPGGTVQGHMQTIDELGCLVLQTRDGEEKITAGDLLPGSSLSGREKVSLHG